MDQNPITFWGGYSLLFEFMIVFYCCLTADPKGIELVIPDCIEDQEIIPFKSYYGGKEGNGEYLWYRTWCKPDESNILDISSADFVLVGKNM